MPLVVVMPMQRFRDGIRRGRITTCRSPRNKPSPGMNSSMSPVSGSTDMTWTQPFNTNPATLCCSRMSPAPPDDFQSPRSRTGSWI